MFKSAVLYKRIDFKNLIFKTHFKKKYIFKDTPSPASAHLHENI